MEENKNLCTIPAFLIDTNTEPQEKVVSTDGNLEYAENKFGFVSYGKVHRLGTKETDGILNSKFFTFPKIDGANASISFEYPDIENCILTFHSRTNSKARLLYKRNSDGSFTRHETILLQNDRFRGAIDHFERVGHILINHFFLSGGRMHDITIFGEWLVPHTVKYEKQFYNRFYVFDLYDKLTRKFIPYLTGENEGGILGKFHIDPENFMSQRNETKNPWFILSQILNKHYKENIMHIVPHDNIDTQNVDKAIAQALELPDPCNAKYREGIVIKNYDFTNAYGRQEHAKVIHDMFSETKVKKITKDKDTTEAGVVRGIIERYFTFNRIEKNIHKIEMSLEENATFSDKNFHQLIGIVFHDVISEELFDILKKFKQPTINFKLLFKEAANVTIEMAKQYQYQKAILSQLDKTDTNEEKNP